VAALVGNSNPYGFACTQSDVAFGCIPSRAQGRYGVYEVGSHDGVAVHLLDMVFRHGELLSYFRFLAKTGRVM
jgi:hypothetical protein